MANNPITRRFNPGDYKGAPDWFTGRFLSALNLFVEPVFQLLQGRISFFAQCNVQEYVFTLTAGATADLNKIQFTKTMAGSPVGLIKIAANVSTDPSIAILAAVDFSWYVNGSTVYITAINGLTNGTTYTIRVLLF